MRVRALLLSTLILTLLALTACSDLPETTDPDPAATPPPAATRTPPPAATRTPSEAQVSPVEQAFEYYEAECPIELPDEGELECGYLLVPEKWADPDSPQIELAVAILYADVEDPWEDPIVYLAGGPGSSALDEFASDPEGWIVYSFRQERDLIFIDQRGTGYSLPTLNCPEVETLEGFEESENPEREANLACAERLRDEGVDLSAYNSVESAADLDALRQALGYEQWNLLGISYGTRLAMTAMREHPAGIRTVILDSPFPPVVDTPFEEAINSWEVLQVLFQGCASDPSCDGSYPDLESIFLETVARMNEEPGLTLWRDAESGEEEEIEVWGDDLVGALVQALYDYNNIPLLPRIIYEASEGGFDTYNLLTAEEGATRGRDGDEHEDVSDSEGMYLSVTCHEEYPFNDYEVVEVRARDLIPVELHGYLLGAVEENFITCKAWGAGAAKPEENEVVVSDIPTLILAGEYDPVTPPKWGAVAAEGLSVAHLFVFPGIGHAVLNAGECPDSIVWAFLDDPESEPDSSCIAEMPALEFFLPDDEIEWE